MSIRFRNVRSLGDQLSIPIPRDENGFLGRECPKSDCEGYFKIKPGTGLTGPDLQCVCPYCGHSASPQSFWTKEQVEYARSMAMRQISEALTLDLKKLEFDHKPRGMFGVGISMKVKPGRPVPIRHYREKTLETGVTCAKCTLEYSVFGVFAFCPDCGVHNSVQILQKNLVLVTKQLELAASQSDVDLSRHLIEDALENCVSSFDGFTREQSRMFCSKATNPEKATTLSFQNLNRASHRVQQLWGFPLQDLIPVADWEVAHRSFMRRHLLAHRSGVIDQQYIDASGDRQAIAGRRTTITPDEVRKLSAVVHELGERFAERLARLFRQ